MGVDKMKTSTFIYVHSSQWPQISGELPLLYSASTLGDAKKGCFFAFQIPNEYLGALKAKMPSAKVTEVSSKVYDHSIDAVVAEVADKGGAKAFNLSSVKLKPEQARPFMSHPLIKRNPLLPLVWQASTLHMPIPGGEQSLDSFVPAAFSKLYSIGAFKQVPFFYSRASVPAIYR
jgi:hypothetical protein